MEFPPVVLVVLDAECEDLPLALRVDVSVLVEVVSSSRFVADTPLALRVEVPRGVGLVCADLDVAEMGFIVARAPAVLPALLRVSPLFVDRAVADEDAVPVRDFSLVTSLLEADEVRELDRYREGTTFTDSHKT